MHVKCSRISVCYILQGSTATHLRCGGKYGTFVANFLVYISVKEFWKSANILNERIAAQFFDSLCINSLFVWPARPALIDIVFIRRQTFFFSETLESSVNNECCRQRLFHRAVSLVIAHRCCYHRRRSGWNSVGDAWWAPKVDRCQMGWSMVRVSPLQPTRGSGERRELPQRGPKTDFGVFEGHKTLLFVSLWQKSEGDNLH